MTSATRPAAIGVAQLDDWEAALRRCYEGSASGPIFVALRESIREFDIPIEPFLRLIEANRQDHRIRAL